MHVRSSCLLWSCDRAQGLVVWRGRAPGQTVGPGLSHGLGEPCEYGVLPIRGTALEGMPITTFSLALLPPWVIGSVKESRFGCRSPHLLHVAWYGMLCKSLNLLEAQDFQLCKRAMMALILPALSTRQFADNGELWQCHAYRCKLLCQMWAIIENISGASSFSFPKSVACHCHFLRMPGDCLQRQKGSLTRWSESEERWVVGVKKRKSES